MQHLYFPHKMPVALDGSSATFVFPQAEEETPSAVRTWGSQPCRAVGGARRGRHPSALPAARRLPEALAAAEALNSTRPA